jgi:hypothetical protein
MDAQVGDRIIIESQKVGEKRREGVVLEVISSPSGTAHYRVQWDDGHESTFWPAAGAVRTVHQEQAKAKHH